MDFQSSSESIDYLFSQLMPLISSTLCTLLVKTLSHHSFRPRHRTKYFNPQATPTAPAVPHTAEPVGSRRPAPTAHAGMARLDSVRDFNEVQRGTVKWGSCAVRVTASTRGEYRPTGSLGWSTDQRFKAQVWNAERAPSMRRWLGVSSVLLLDVAGRRVVQEERWECTLSRLVRSPMSKSASAARRHPSTQMHFRIRLPCSILSLR